MNKPSKKVAARACMGEKRALQIEHEIMTDSCAAEHEKSTSPCAYGCLGLGDCVAFCKFEAMHINDEGLVEIDREKCIGCGLCAKKCPRQVLKIVPRERLMLVRCNAPGKGKDKVKICLNACLGCTACVQRCPEKAIKIVDGLAEIDPELCLDCGLCRSTCPSHYAFAKTLDSLF